MKLEQSEIWTRWERREEPSGAVVEPVSQAQPSQPGLSTALSCICPRWLGQRGAQSREVGSQTGQTLERPRCSPRGEGLWAG